VTSLEGPALTGGLPHLSVYYESIPHMHPITPPPIGDPESLGELTRLVTYSFATVSASLESMGQRLDKLVTAEKHAADIERLQRSHDDLVKTLETEKARSINTRRWTIGSAIAFLSAAVPSLQAFLSGLS